MLDPLELPAWTVEQVCLASLGVLAPQDSLETKASQEVLAPWVRLDSLVSRELQASLEGLGNRVALACLERLEAQVCFRLIF